MFGGLFPCWIPPSSSAALVFGLSPRPASVSSSYDYSCVYFHPCGSDRCGGVSSPAFSASLRIFLICRFSCSWSMFRRLRQFFAVVRTTAYYSIALVICCSVRLALCFAAPLFSLIPILTLVPPAKLALFLYAVSIGGSGIRSPPSRLPCRLCRVSHLWLTLGILQCCVL